MKQIKYILLIVALCAAMPAGAQFRHEVGLSVGSGMSAVNYSFNKSVFSNNVHLLRGMGGEASLGYTFLFFQNWGVGIGAGAAMYNSTAVLSGSSIETAIQTTTHLPVDYTLTTNLHYYEEQQQILSVNAPFWLQYETSDLHRFYMRLGGKIAIPLQAKYEVQNASLTNSTLLVGIYDQPTWNDHLNINYSRDIDVSKLDIGFMLSVEAGVKWQLSSMWSLYTGAYFDYGLIFDMFAGNKEPFMAEANDYNSKERSYNHNDIFYSKNGNSGKELIGSVSPMAVGAVIRLAVGTGTYVARNKAKDVTQPYTKSSKDKEQKESKDNGERKNAAQNTDTLPDARTTGFSGGRQNQNQSQKLAYQDMRNSSHPYVFLPGQQQPPTTPYYYFVTPQQDKRTTVDRQRIMTMQDTTIGPNTLTHVQVFDGAGIMVNEQIIKGQIITVEVPYKKGVYLIKLGKKLKKMVMY